jgi:S1-C subfamily serine protease
MTQGVRPRIRCARVTAIDWIIVAFTIVLALMGYRQGFVVGALSLGGFVAGAIIGTRIGAKLIGGEGSMSPYAPLFGLFGALIGGMIISTGLEGLGIHLRRRMTLPGLAALDGLLGAVLAGALGLGIAWVAGAVALQTPGPRTLRRDIQRSEILRRLNDALPPSAFILNALARFDPFPHVTGPGADVPPPREAIARDPDVVATQRSVMRILGTACGLGISGSGWVAAPGTVVTNAHVVAGEDDTTVQVAGEGPRLRAQAVVFDPANDIAVLRVADLNAPTMAMVGDPQPGTPGAVVGYPHNGPFRIRPARLGQTRQVISQDAYGRGPIRRSVTSLRGLVQPGNSGGPMVDGAGRVLTTVFAATRGGANPGGYGVPNAVVRAALTRASGPVGTGPCAH